ncbi:hypothetical protein RRF57_005324 [Xylaria bambusicola]|uniref:Uncharacterized protein n=1 Tax=Xylaria bambusicola TaxID=326684 RepID=A0AAN7UPZ3_9PEZI
MWRVAKGASSSAPHSFPVSPQPWLAAAADNANARANITVFSSRKLVFLNFKVCAAHKVTTYRSAVPVLGKKCRCDTRHVFESLVKSHQIVDAPSHTHVQLAVSRTMDPVSRFQFPVVH